MVAQASETRERFFVVRFHELRITGDIGSDDRREPSRNRLRAQNRFPGGARLDRRARRGRLDQAPSRGQSHST
jgi:hypothetical protein